MALFSLFALMDGHDAYKAAMKQIIRRRYHGLYQHMGADLADDADAVDYCSLIDLEALGAALDGASPSL